MKKQIKWIITFVLIAIISAGLLTLVNVIVDPFGVFGDYVLDFYEYNMTSNPRLAKVKYLDKNHGNYDSYVIGGSKSSSLNPDKLKEYFNGNSFYNNFVYGGTFRDYEMEVKYILDNYEVENIILHESLHEVETDPFGTKTVNNMYHANITGENKLDFYRKFLFMDLKQAYNKLVAYVKRNKDIVDPSAVFLAETGVYNKIKRDKESYESIGEFLNIHPEFDRPMYNGRILQTEYNIEALKNIKKMCEEKGVNFVFVVAPTYFREMNIYETKGMIEYYKQISEITDFWNFSGYTSIAYDPRNFYDLRHYRNSVGEMMIDRMFSDDENILKDIPDDFGQLVTKDNFKEMMKIAFPEDIRAEHSDTSLEEVDVPILVYHHISNEKDAALTPDKLRKDLTEIKKYGYNTIFYKDLIDYVENGTKLPQNPIIISFDDGYLSNYQYLFPLLKELDMKAEISIIGWSVGRDTYIDSDKAIIPHFTWGHALEMYNSGHVMIQSHTYDMHKYDPNGDVERKGVLKNNDESYGEYERALSDDLNKLSELIQDKIGEKEVAFTYPNGYNDMLTEKLLKDMDYKITVTVSEGINTIMQGNSSSLYKLKRIIGDYYNGNIVDKIKIFNK
ncbi:polysaccharide deacetylase family protein [Sedimentibacter sp. zth1]|uniref:polysaccharide deacetylase family protein n=1 Tax=Sedimentibacter sp. zth1 TaxID=2816908 RepID=UPI001A934F22|nr:polysaccharide deacetylase family protein [Sedimentibacter sp. zth1]QSX05220.1 polysaccharide deacetylase family protein [Sedimentibacter sp. zth1]